MLFRLSEYCLYIYWEKYRPKAYECSGKYLILSSPMSNLIKHFFILNFQNSIFLLVIILNDIQGRKLRVLMMVQIYRKCGNLSKIKVFQQGINVNFYKYFLHKLFWWYQNINNTFYMTFKQVPRVFRLKESRDVSIQSLINNYESVPIVPNTT